jgi:hypothetical protein
MMPEKPAGAYRLSEKIMLQYVRGMPIRRKVIPIQAGCRETWQVIRSALHPEVYGGDVLTE